jgi:type VI protein secretion system component Hcp
MNTINLLAIGALSVVFTMLATSSYADAAIYVKIPGVPGDVTIEDDRYNDGTWFEIDSFSFGIENDRSKGETAREKGGTGDINIGVGDLSDVSITKSMDSATGQLAQFAINGNSAGTAEIDFVEVADVPEDGVVYLKYKLDRVFVKSWSTSGDADDDRPVEEVAFYYNKIAFAYNPTTDGIRDSRYGMSWDNVQNVPWDGVVDSLLDILFPSGPGAP